MNPAINSQGIPTPELWWDDDDDSPADQSQAIQDDPTAQYILDENGNRIFPN